MPARSAIVCFRDGTRSRSVSTLRKLLLRFMAGKSIRRLAWFRVADWPNRQKYQQFWRVKTWGSIQINFFAAKKDRRTTLPDKIFLRPFAEKSRASGQCTRPEGAALVVNHLSERGLVRGRLDRHAALGGALGAVLKLEGVVRGSRELCPRTSRCRSRRYPRGAS